MHLSTESTWSDEFLNFMSHHDLPLDLDDRRHIKIVKEESVYALSRTVFHEIDKIDLGDWICHWCWVDHKEFDEQFIHEMREKAVALKRKLVWPEDTTVIYWGDQVLKIRWGTFLKYFPNFVWVSDEWAYVARPFDSRCLWITYSNGVNLFERERI